MKQASCFLLLCIMLTSCNLRNESKTVLAEKKEYLAKCSPNGMELYSYAHDLNLMDDLILVTSHRDTICRVFSIEDNFAFVTSYGRIGQGPGEFIQPLKTHHYNNEFALNDVNKDQLTILAIDPNLDEIKIKELKQLKVDKQAANKKEMLQHEVFISRLDKKHYVSLCRGANGRFFSLRDSALRLCNFFGASPIGEIHDKDSGIGVSGKLFGKLATNGNGSMCFAAFNLPYLSCYTLENEMMRERCSFYFDTTSFDIRNGNLLFSKDKAKGRTLDLKIDDLYIYILYSNRLLSEESTSLIETSMANNIRIFDYDGNAIASIKLDNYISSFDISHSKKKLFAIAYMPEQTLVEFDLPAEFWKELFM